MSGALGPALEGPATGYSFVYHAELALLFITLIALAPLVRLRSRDTETREIGKIGLAEFPN